MSALRSQATLESRSRAALMRGIREDNARKAEALHAAEFAAEARITLKRQDRVRAAIVRLQPLVTRLEMHLREELLDAMRAGDNNRRILVEAEVDELYRLADAAAQEAGR
jgi:hypothetical protein